MRIFVAGASGVIGVRLIPLLVAGGHTVAGMTRSPQKAHMLAELRAEPVVCDVFDTDALTRAVTDFGADVVLHQLTDLPDRLEDIPTFAERSNDMLVRGTRNLLAAACAARVWRLYMAGSRLGFERNHIQLHQILGVRLCENGKSGMPLRPDWEPLAVPVA